ncbi:MAG TPA: Flp pilus assembly protein CpaB [Acidisarcina sp.]
MTARRLTAALIAALIISGIFTFWLSRKLGGKTAAPPARQHYVAAARALDAGEALSAASVVMTEWPVSIPISGAFARPEDLLGRVLLYPLAGGEPILDRQLAPPGSGVGLTGRIPAGMRAVSLRSDEVVGVAGFLFPGTHVDVLVTYRSEKSPEPATATVLQDVVVLAAGHQINPDPDVKEASVDVVTLMLKPEDADRAVLASTQGTIHFVLRNGGDRGRTDSEPIGLSQLVSTVPAAQPLVRPAHAAAGPRARAYSVETVMGGKESVTTF